MDPSTIDEVQVSWLFKALSAISAIAAVAIGTLYRGLVKRVQILEEDSASHGDITEIKDTLKELGHKIDAGAVRAEERGNRMVELLISTLRGDTR